MMAKEDLSLSSAKTLYESLLKDLQLNVDFATCESKILKLKLILAESDLLSYKFDSKDSIDACVLARNILETGAQLCIKHKEIPGFARYMSQLKPYYYDFGKNLPHSENMYPLLGLNLLRLLMKNQMATFHTELELIGPENLGNPYIEYPIKIEQYLAEGSYNKVWRSWDTVPLQEFLLFTEILSCTIRNEIAQCIQKTYTSLPISSASVLMYLKDPSEIHEFIKKYNWTVDESTQTIHFEEADPEMELPATEKIFTILKYARELERIV